MGIAGSGPATAWGIEMNKFRLAGLDHPAWGISADEQRQKAIDTSATRLP